MGYYCLIHFYKRIKGKLKFDSKFICICNHVEVPSSFLILHPSILLAVLGRLSRVSTVLWARKTFLSTRQSVLFSHTKRPLSSRAMDSDGEGRSRECSL